MKVFLLLSTVLLAAHLGKASPVGTCPAVNPEVDVRLPDSENCAIFYKCDWGTPVLMNCPPTLAFNTITNDCDYPENVNCDRNGVVDGGVDGGNPTGTGPMVECPTESVYATFIPDKTDCTIYYICNYGNPVAQKCADGLYYDGNIWACTYPEQAQCFTYSPLEGDNGGGNNGDGPVGGGTGGVVGECPAVNGLEDVLLPDIDNCAVFYKCDNGIPVLINCPDDLYFNSETDQCDFPANVNCDRTGTGNGGDNGNGGGNGGDNGGGQPGGNGSGPL
ncbi:hypothetical protein Trydic_g2252, partial [Trypoxylus dichotomus]